MTKLKMVILNMLILGTLMTNGWNFTTQKIHYYKNNMDRKGIEYSIVNDKENHKVSVYENDTLVLSKNYMK